MLPAFTRHGFCRAQAWCAVSHGGHCFVVCCFASPLLCDIVKTYGPLCVALVVSVCVTGDKHMICLACRGGGAKDGGLHGVLVLTAQPIGGAMHEQCMKPVPLPLRYLVWANDLAYRWR